MAASQFQVYSYNDVSHPVLTSGTSGSFLALLNACLVTGYGSKVAAGWTKTGSLYGALNDSQSCGILVQPTGSGVTFYIQDNAPSVTAGLRQARITGYDAVTNFTASTGTSNSSSVVGTNPFPSLANTPIAMFPCVDVRKSTDISLTERSWIVFADSSSVYGFIQSGDAGGVYYSFMFGDFYSIKSGSADTSRAMIVGYIGEAAAVTAANDRLDALSLVNAATTGHFFQRSYTGIGTSVLAGKHGDGNKGNTTLLVGITQYPNAADNGFYLSPVWVHESANATIRGRMRGFYHACHALGSFSDGQTFVGGGDFAGKTFQMVKQSPNSGVWCIEVSNTVETN